MLEGVFKYEPEITYYYTYYISKIKEITQSGIAPMTERRIYGRYNEEISIYRSYYIINWM
ncbi:hypothetical protein PATA110616_23135 [Paenibacillus tarimensis]